MMLLMMMMIHNDVFIEKIEKKCSSSYFDDSVQDCHLDNDNDDGDVFFFFFGKIFSNKIVQ